MTRNSQLARSVISRWWLVLAGLAVLVLSTAAGPLASHSADVRKAPVQFARGPGELAATYNYDSRQQLSARRQVPTTLSRPAGTIALQSFAEPRGARSSDSVSGYAANTEGAVAAGGSGPWVPEGAAPGGAVAQATEGSCVSACGEMLSGGRLSQSGLIERLGAPAESTGLAGELFPEWQGRYFSSSEEAVAAAQRGPMGAVLQAPGRIGHMVVTEPTEGGWLVRDPWEGGSTYPVDENWIEQWVSAGVFR